MLGAIVGLGLGCAVLRVNPPRRRRRRRARSNPSSFDARYVVHLRMLGQRGGGSGRARPAVLHAVTTDARRAALAPRNEAVCGVKPAFSWSDPVEAAVTCPRCLRRLSQSNPRRNPPVAKRSKDFAELGTYDVVLGDGTTVQIARDGGSGGGGWWYVEWPNLHYSQRLLGFTKAEALAAVEDKVARLRAGNYR